MTWNRCEVVRDGKACGRLTEFKTGHQCAACRDWKFRQKQPKEANKARCRAYFEKNREKERARRKAYYWANREQEILSATVRRNRRWLTEKGISYEH